MCFRGRKKPQIFSLSFVYLLTYAWALVIWGTVRLTTTPRLNRSHQVTQKHLEPLKTFNRLNDGSLWLYGFDSIFPPCFSLCEMTSKELNSPSVRPTASSCLGLGRRTWSHPEVLEANTLLSFPTGAYPNSGGGELQAPRAQVLSQSYSF